MIINISRKLRTLCEVVAILIAVLLITLNCNASEAPPFDQVKIEKVRVCYLSPTAYPLSNSDIDVIAVVWVNQPARAQDTGLSTGRVDVPYAYQAIVNDGKVPIWKTGTEGFGIYPSDILTSPDDPDRPERIPVNDSSDQAGISALQAWPTDWPEPTFKWTLLYEESRQHSSHHYDFRYRLVEDCWGNVWHHEQTFSTGVHRIALTMTIKNDSGADVSFSSLDGVPTDTMGRHFPPQAYATRINVKDAALSNPYLSFISMYENTPYAWGGSSFGGNTGTEIGADWGYGLDCSGLVWCGAIFCGLRSVPSKFSTTDLVDPKYTKSVPPLKLQPGDLLVYSGVHVYTVVREYEDHGVTRVDLLSATVLPKASDWANCLVVEQDGNRLTPLLNHYVPRELLLSPGGVNIEALSSIKGRGHIGAMASQPFNFLLLPHLDKVTLSDETDDPRLLASELKR